jgi:UDP-glucose 4-epimerase
VQDAVRAVIALTKDDSTIGDYFNVGGIGEITIKELATKIIERTGSKSKLVSIPFDQAYGPGFEDMQRRVPDISKINAKLGWQPTHTLDSIIDDVAAHLK